MSALSSAPATERSTVGVATVVLDVLVVTLSWALTSTVFALKYARLYYAGGDGGIDVHQDQPPAYSDFAYLSFAIGMGLSVAVDLVTNLGRS